VITPIYKGGIKSKPANYRPVALTNHLTKLFERVMRKQIVNHLNDHNLFNSTQHGFRAGRSTLTQLLNYYDDILFYLEMGKEVDAIYLDFAKAFDKVDHGIILHKLKQMCIGGKVLMWIRTFLKSRQQQVRVQQVLSDPVTVTSGVPQGSVLGPLLFLILMSDINLNVTDAKVGSYADDTRTWKGIASDADTSSLQQQLNSIYVWADTNNMSFNETKFECLSFGKSNRIPIYKTSSNNAVEVKESLRDLGITIENNLTFKKHILATVTKGHRMAGWALRTFISRDQYLMKTLLKSLIVSQVEYGCVIWGPYNQQQINELERVQSRFTSRIACFNRYDATLDKYICQVTYDERLKQLGIYSLQRRRERYAIIYMYKVLIGLVPNPGFDCYPDNRTQWKIRSKMIPATSRVPTWIKNARNSSLFVTGPVMFNSLPYQLREKEANTQIPLKLQLSNFKNALDKYLSNIPDVPGTTRNSLIQ